jgi:hypothetical protein
MNKEEILKKHLGCEPVKVIQHSYLEFVLAAMEEYSSCKSPGLKFIKASERLPEYGKELNGKYGTLHVTVAFFEDEVCIRGFDSMKPTKKLLEQIFWLDESTTEELKEERCSICGAEKSEAYQCSTPECPFHQNEKNS